MVFKEVLIMRLSDRKVPLYIVASILFGLKTYIVYRFVFDIELVNLMQELILFINAFVTAFIFFALSFCLSTNSRQLKFMGYLSLIGSFIIYINLIFYCSFIFFFSIAHL